MIVYNCTFMVERGLGPEFLEWFKAEAAEKLLQGGARNMRLTELVEVPDDPDFSDQALSFACQVEFDDISWARQWAQQYLSPFTAAFVTKFGSERAVWFTSILKTIDI